MAKRRLGQHFLIDDTVVDRIIDVFDPVPGETVIEIGPGHGALTRVLLARGADVEAIELDSELAAKLTRLSRQQEGLSVHHEDALQLDVSRFTASGPVRIIGNLPYNISTPLLLHLSTQLRLIRQMTFMLQREVAERLLAATCSKAYGRLSVAIQLGCTIERHFEVEPAAFDPPPQVISSVITLNPRPVPIRLTDRKVFDDLVRAAFGQRRKMLRNALADTASPALLKQAGVDPDWRAENIAVDAYVRLANLIADSVA